MSTHYLACGLYAAAGGITLVALAMRKRLRSGSGKLFAISLAAMCALSFGLSQLLTALRALTDTPFQSSVPVLLSLIILCLTGLILLRPFRIYRLALGLALLTGIAAQQVIAMAKPDSGLLLVLASAASGLLAGIIYGVSRPSTAQTGGESDLELDGAVWWLLIAVLAVSTLFVKFYLFQSVPDGFAVDEGVKAKVGLDVAQGRMAWQPYFLFRESPYFYLVAASIKTFGFSIPAVRFTSTAICLFGLILHFLVIRRMFGQGTAFVSTLFLAASLWHTSISRTAERLVLVPPVQMAVLGLTWLALDRLRLWWFAACGLVLAAGFYTYPPARVLPLFVVGAMALYLLQHRGWRTLRSLALGGIVLAGVFYIASAGPLGKNFFKWKYYFIDKERLGYKVDPEAENKEEMVKNLRVLVGTWHIRPAQRGTMRPFNGPAPLLDPVTRLLFPIGLGMCIARAKRRSYALLLLAFFVGWIPGIVSWPFERRIILATQLVFPMAAIAFVQLARQFSQGSEAGSRRSRLTLMVAGAALCAFLAQAWGILGERFYNYTGYTTRCVPLSHAARLAGQYDIRYLTFFYDRYSFCVYAAMAGWEDPAAAASFVRSYREANFFPISPRGSLPTAIICAEGYRHAQLERMMKKYYPDAILETRKSEAGISVSHYIYLVSNNDLQRVWEEHKQSGGQDETERRPRAKRGAPMKPAPTAAPAASSASADAEQPVTE